MYLTLYKSVSSENQQLDYDQIMNNTQTKDLTYYKTTIEITNPKPKQDLSQAQISHINKVEQKLITAWEYLLPYQNNYEEQYYEFQIPKRSGGLRTINAPNTEFKEALSKVKDIFEQDMKCLAHNCAYAYTKERCILDALKLHQANQSNWYLKIDLTNFFPNCTPEIIFNQLIQLYPFYYISEEHQNILKNIIKVCCLHGGLPQGTPISPILTNLIMIPYDYKIYSYCKRGTGQHYVYTRYADDILISCKDSFLWREMQDTLQEILQPFQIKKEKTRYGSKNGSNWNLGLMVNKDNNITLGSNKKKTLNAMLNNFIRDYQNNNRWSREDTYTLQGQLSWLKHIEPGYYNYIVQKYETKYNIRDYRELIKNILR